MRRIFKLFVLVLFPVITLGQTTSLTNQYILNPMTINPAYAGHRGALSMAAFYRNQWVGISGSPKTISMAVDLPLFDRKVGAGLVVSHDKIGVTSETRFNTNYSYKIRINDGTLSLGLGAGLITTNTAWSGLVVVDPEDRDLLVDSRVFTIPDFSFGVYYSNSSFFAGFSIPEMLGHSFNFNKNKYITEVSPDKYNYLLNTGYAFNLTSKTKFLTSTLLTYSYGKKLQYDLNSHVNIMNSLWFGLSYRSTESIAGLFQIAVNDQLRMAYTYDFDIGMLGKYNSGSHEIMLRYEFRYKVEVVNPLIF
jgi:type IX secretion system PorP/SprF family membrane protein